LTTPTGARNKQIHLMLEVTDRNPEFGMTDYRRIVMEVSAVEKWIHWLRSIAAGRHELMPIARQKGSF